MFLSPHKHLCKKTFAFFICSVVVFTPLSHTFTTQKAEAQLFGGRGLDLVKDPQNILTNTLQTIAAQALEQKELVLDRIFYNLAQKTLQKMTGDILSFINTGGPNGEPMFITDWSDYMQEVTTEVDQEFPYGDDLEALCGQFEVNIRVALAAVAQREQPGGFAKKIACTIDKPGVDVNAFLRGNFNAGGWSTWFETVLKPENTTLGGFIAVNQERKDLGATAREEAEQESAGGVKPIKPCANGKCSITTPASAILAQLEQAIGAPMQSILNADEFDEIIGSLFGNLANQALSGVNGLLGLSDKVNGQNYFDRIQNDPTNNVNNGQSSSNPIDAALGIETRAGIAQVGIINAIQDITRCSPDTVLPAQLQTIVADFTPKVIATGATVAKLSNMSLQYASSTSQNQKQGLLTQLEDMRINGELEGLALAIQYEQFLSIDLANFITQFKESIGYVETSCTPAPLTS